MADYKLGALGAGLLMAALAAAQSTGASRPEDQRWKAEVPTGSLCNLNLYSFPGGDGVYAEFVGSRDGSVQLVFMTSRKIYPRGGKFRIARHVDPAWQGTTDDRGFAVLPGPRAATLASAVAGGESLDLVFVPDKGEPLALSSGIAELKTAGAMYNACMRTLASRPREKIPADVRFSVDHDVGECQLVGTYNSLDTGVWIYLVSNPSQQRLTITRRPTGAHPLVVGVSFQDEGTRAEVDYSTAGDISVELDARKFDALRRDLAAGGRGVILHKDRDHGLTTVFGGPLAAVEVAMFDACVGAGRS